VGPGGWKKNAFMISRSAKLTMPSLLKSVSASLVKKAALSMLRSPKFTTRSPFRSESQRLPKWSLFESRWTFAVRFF